MKKLIRGITAAVLASAVLCTLAFFSLGSKIQSGNSSLPIAINPGVSHRNYTNIALFGVDSRDGNLESANSDAILVASLNHRTKELQLVSVYRDTVLDTGDGLFQKCNAAYLLNGPEQAVNMLNQNLDLDIQHYISVDFKALSEIVDQLGGVDVQIDAEEAGYINYYIEETSRIAGQEVQFLPEEAGTYTLNGPQAVSYTRIRYTAGNDFRRTERQRTILTAVTEKLKHTNPVKLYQIASAVLPMIQTNYSAAELASLAINLVQTDIKTTMGFPFVPYTMDIPGLGSCIVPADLAQEVVQLHQQLFEDPSPVLSATAVETSMNLDLALGR